MTGLSFNMLCQRVGADMALRDYAKTTQRDHLRRLANFAAFLGHSPETATFEDVRRYQPHLKETGAPFRNGITSLPHFDLSFASLSVDGRLTGTLILVVKNANCQWC
jgi:hypothetical protein